MDLFKSVFASDEELDDNDDDIGDDVEIGAGKVEPALESSEFRPSVVSTGGDNLDNTDSLEEVPTSPPSKSSVPDLSVHQLFKHLFDPQIDNGGLLCLLFPFLIFVYNLRVMFGKDSCPLW